jgi:hypothetical protein
VRTSAGNGGTIPVAAAPGKAVSILGALRTGTIIILATTVADCQAVPQLVRQEARRAA